MKKHSSDINDRFREYFRENFFAEKPEELERFLEALTKPLPKTIRVNTNRISVEDFQARAKRNNWTLTPTNNPTVFRIDRTEIKIPLGHTLEHLLGYFYIQELSASMSVHYLAQPHHNPFPPHPNPLLRGEGVKREDEYGYDRMNSKEYVQELAKEMRKEPTREEEIIWGYLRNEQFNGWKFRRQHPVQRYVLDFYCASEKIAIEMDGRIHDNTEQQEYDLIRDEFLHTLGIRTVRLKNEDIINKTKQEFYNFISPLLLGEGLGVRGEGSEDRLGVREKTGEGNNTPFLILDMAASPGGKTTQLAEHFPSSIIVANEPTRDRMAQLVSNTERLGNDRIMITNYDGGFYANLRETFDRILIDAPCSGEGIGFKESQTVKYWNLKNIHTIARLQTKLLDAAFRALKTGGEVLYSTCTLNLIENEGVVNEIQSRYPESFEVLFEKRFWPHEEASGGFFVCKIRKNSPVNTPHPNLLLEGEGINSVNNLPSPSRRRDGDEVEKGGYKTRNQRPIKTNEELIPLTKDHERLLSKFTETVGLDLSGHHLFEFKRDILAIEKNSAAKALLQTIFPIRLGQRIGRIEEGIFTPDNRLGRDFELIKAPVYELPSEQELDDYLRGKEITIPPSPSRRRDGDEVENVRKKEGDEVKGYSILRYDGLNLGLESMNPKNGHFTNTFPREWQRK